MSEKLHPYRCKHTRHIFCIFLFLYRQLRRYSLHDNFYKYFFFRKERICGAYKSHTKRRVDSAPPNSTCIGSGRGRGAGTVRDLHSGNGFHCIHTDHQSSRMARREVAKKTESYNFSLPLLSASPFSFLKAYLVLRTMILLLRSTFCLIFPVCKFPFIQSTFAAFLSSFRNCPKGVLYEYYQGYPPSCYSSGISVGLRQTTKIEIQKIHQCNGQYENLKP